MPRVVICSAERLEGALSGTLLWRHEMDRRLAGDATAAVAAARQCDPDLVLVDAKLAEALGIVRALREDPITREVPVGVMIRASSGLRPLPFLDAGANEILHLPAGPEWDERLTRLFKIRAREQSRVSLRVELACDGAAGQPFPVTALNVSPTGMLVHSTHPLGGGEHVNLSFLLPASTEAVRGRAVVVREAGEGRYGLQFLYLEGDGLERLRHMVSSAAG